MKSTSPSDIKSLITPGSGYSSSVRTGHVQQHNTLENGLLIAANVSVGHLRKHKYFYYIPRISNSPHKRKQRNSSSFSKADILDFTQQKSPDNEAVVAYPPEPRRIRHIPKANGAPLEQPLAPPLASSKGTSKSGQQQQKFQRYYIYSAAPRMRDELPPGIPEKNLVFRNIGSKSPQRRAFNGSVSVEEDVAFRKVKKRSAADDMLSKNITQILENLLKSYENSQMPTHGQGIPTVVKTNILIRSMGPVSELDMDYSMDCYFRQYWRDKRLSFHGPIKSLSLSIKMLERIWRPDTYFYNGKHSHVHTITVPNKLLRLSQDGEILYSMRLTIKAGCLMQLQSFPMDRQSCPLVLGSYAYSRQQLIYQWQTDDSVNFVPGLSLSQFDLISFHQKNYTFARREGEFSVLHVSFNLQRHTGYFLIQVYVPCILIVVLSWVSFWIHREATSDRVGLGITTVLTLSTISLDSRTDLPKVRYATALDWFLLMNFIYCIATLLEFAGVHYFTKVRYSTLLRVGF
ncbi:conserved hypothetical protein [Culex quinquefasciatus]|uniref:Uncharacterized protein n=1 Tax=Culex quinquefasciatus TaxID=7176 RepID=B0WT04_CULQU|nr:conserved hypothetical protein [Culex quinquefasciatus]|eukprot:XP_001870768.1 conserved hypothetical protein [Culex quinquefasciatus]